MYVPRGEAPRSFNIYVFICLVPEKKYMYLRDAEGGKHRVGPNGS